MKQPGCTVKVYVAVYCLLLAGVSEAWNTRDQCVHYLKNKEALNELWENHFNYRKHQGCLEMNAFSQVAERRQRIHELGESDERGFKESMDFYSERTDLLIFTLDVSKKTNWNIYKEVDKWLAPHQYQFQQVRDIHASITDPNVAAVMKHVYALQDMTAPFSPEVYRNPNYEKEYRNRLVLDWSALQNSQRILDVMGDDVGAVYFMKPGFFLKRVVYFLEEHERDDADVRLKRKMLVLCPFKGDVQRPLTANEVENAEPVHEGLGEFDLLRVLQEGRFSDVNVNSP